MPYALWFALEPKGVYPPLRPRNGFSIPIIQSYTYSNVPCNCSYQQHLQLAITAYSSLSVPALARRLRIFQAWIEPDCDNMSAEKVTRRMQDYQRQISKIYSCGLCSNGPSFPSEAKLFDHAAQLHSDSVGTSRESKSFKSYAAEAAANKTYVLHHGTWPGPNLPDPTAPPSERGLGWGKHDTSGYELTSLIPQQTNALAKACS